MGKRTALYDCHIAANAKIVDFAGWDMPLHYGSQLQEHKAVRENAGVFDVSHMTIVDLHGEGVQPYLRRLLANNINRLTPGKALYTCILNDNGGVIDDLIAYKMEDNFYRLIVNSGTRDKDIAWLQKQLAGFDVALQERADLAMVAVQGPKAIATLAKIFSAEQHTAIQTLKPFHAIAMNNYFIARTGYTGEDGFEIILPENNVADFWNQLLKVEIVPCGLGARDTLRLEAGLNLYGSDMDETVTPLESNLAWTVAFDPEDRDFIGRSALEKQRKEGVKNRLVGLVLEAPGVLRNHQKVVIENIGEGEITSGSFSPTLSRGIALARVPAEIGHQCLVEMRGKYVTAQVIKPPFVRHGKQAFELNVITEQS